MQVRYVSQEFMRKIFNKSRYYKHALEGKVLTTIGKERHLPSPPKGEPFCTRSQYIIYCTQAGEFIAGVHQYLRPDGTLGGSGKPDPKRMIYKGQLFAVYLEG